MNNRSRNQQNQGRGQDRQIQGRQQNYGQQQQSGQFDQTRQFGGQSFDRDQFRGQSQSGRGRGGRGMQTEGFGRNWMNIPLEGISHRGLGPKGYSRSDDRIREDVSEILTEHHRIDATALNVEVKQGEVTLAGTVTDVNQKYLIDRVLHEVPGVLQVFNNIRVQSADLSDETRTTGQNNQQRSNKDVRPSAS